MSANRRAGQSAAAGVGSELIAESRQPVLHGRFETVVLDRLVRQLVKQRGDALLESDRVLFLLWSANITSRREAHPRGMDIFQRRTRAEARRVLIGPATGLPAPRVIC